MNGYELRDLTDGSVELVEISPTVIATFHDRAHAERYFNILAEAGEMVSAPPQQDAVKAAPAAPTQQEWDQASLAISNGDAMDDVAKMLGVSFHQMRGRYAAWVRRQNVAKAKADIPDAATTAEVEPDPEPEPDPQPTPEIKETRQPSVPAVMQSQAVTPFVSLVPNDIEPTNCTLCARPFNASAISDGRCARCRRD